MANEEVFSENALKLKKSQFLRKICNFVYILDEYYSVLQPVLTPSRSSCLNSALYLYICHLNYRLPHIPFARCVLLHEALKMNKHLLKPSSQPSIFFFSFVFSSLLPSSSFLSFSFCLVSFFISFFFILPCF